MTTNYSQASQDLFVLEILKGKKNGHFLEIGSNHPVIDNNTYLLENNFGWRGIMVECDDSFRELYTLYRKHSYHYIEDASKMNYYEALKNNLLPKNMDYLQIDLHVNNKSTLDTLTLLDNTVFDEYKFATVTFEHDIYTGDFFDTRKISREIFSKRGYVLLFPDIKIDLFDKECEFEDWYVHPDLVDPSIVEKFKLSDSMNHKNVLGYIRTKQWLL